MFRKNTPGQFMGFVAINASTGQVMTGTTGFAAHLVIDNANQVSATGTVTDKGNGQFSFAFSQADTNGDDISILFTMTDMIPVEKTFVTTAADPTDAQRFGLNSLPSSSTLLVKPAVTLAFTDVSGNLPTNVIQWNNVAVTGMPLPTGSYSAPDNTDIASLLTSIGLGLHTDVTSIKNKTDNLPASPAAIGSPMTLSSTGFDNIVIETGVNPRQALSAIFAAAAGVISGANTNSIVIKGGNVTTTRIAADTDGSGNRTSVILTLPS